MNVLLRTVPFILSLLFLLTGCAGQVSMPAQTNKEPTTVQNGSDGPPLISTAPSATLISSSPPAQMGAAPNSRFFNFVDTPASVHYSQFNAAQVILDPTTGGVIDVSGYRRISVRIGPTKATSFSVFIGKISGATLSQECNLPVDNKIHTFEVVGPQMALFLIGGTANSDENVQLWVYLSS